MLLALSACTEEYRPDIDAEQNVMVVEALLTNEYGSNVVKLHYGMPFDSIISPVPVTKARVYVRDKNNVRYNFTEKKPGHYYSDKDDLRGEYMNEYYLVIESSDGESYQSDKQSMKLSVYSETGYASLEEKRILEQDAEGKNIIIKEDWVNVFVNVKSPEESLPNFRFVPHLVIESMFNRVPPGESESYPHYSWRTFYPEFEINRSLPFSMNQSAQPDQNQINEQPVCSFKIETFILARDSAWVEDYYHPGVFVRQPIDTMVSTIINRVLIIKEYQLNETSSEYYQAIKEQLDSENQIFDPIPTQLLGNIKCMSNPDKKVIGLFEVSSLSLNAYTVRPSLRRQAVDVEKVTPMIPVPNVGTQMDVPPDFWIF